MANIRLVIDAPVRDLWTDASRKVLLSTSAGLMDLEFNYRVAAGGVWGGSAKIILTENGEAWRRLVEGGAAGVAWIYHDRDLDDCTAFDDATDLLWFGVVDSATAERGGDIVTLRLRGAGEFLKDFRYTGVHEGETIGSIASTVAQSMIDAGDTPVKSKDIDTLGASSRKVSVEFKDEPINKVMKALVELAGGESFFSYGVKPAATASSYGTLYFKAWTGHLWEKSGSADRAIASVDKSQLISHTIDSSASGVFNDIKVVGEEIEGDPADTSRVFYTGTAASEESIALYGRRKKTVSESGLRNDGQCLIAAASKARALCSRELKVKTTLFDSLSGLVTANEGGTLKYYSPLYYLKNGGKLLVVRDKPKDYRAWGDSKSIYAATRNATTARYSVIDTGNGPTGADIVNFDPHTMSSTSDRRLVEWTRRQVSTTATSSPATLYIGEVENRLSIAWYASGGAWKLLIAKRDNTGTWGPAAVSAGTVTTAKIQAEHTVALEYYWVSSGTIQVAGHFSDGTTVTTMIAGTNISLSTLYSTGSTDKIVLNGLALNAGVAPAGDASSADYSQVLVWKSWSGTTASFLGGHQNTTPPFKRYGGLVLMTNAGLRDSNDAAFVRYAFGNGTLDGEYAWTTSAVSSESEFQDDSADFTRRNYDYQLGTRVNQRALGTHLEVYPEKIKVTHNGSTAPLLVEVQGFGGLMSASEAIEEVNDRVTEASKNAEKGSK